METGYNTNHSYSSAGNYDLNLTVSDGICTDDTTININVIQNPIAPSPSNVVTCDGYYPTYSSKWQLLFIE